MINRYCRHRPSVTPSRLHEGPASADLSVSAKRLSRLNPDAAGNQLSIADRSVAGSAVRHRPPGCIRFSGWKVRVHRFGEAPYRGPHRTPSPPEKGVALAHRLLARRTRCSRRRCGSLQAQRMCAESRCSRPHSGGWIWRVRLRRRLRCAPQIPGLSRAVPERPRGSICVTRELQTSANSGHPCPEKLAWEMAGRKAQKT